MTWLDLTTLLHIPTDCNLHSEVVTSMNSVEKRTEPNCRVTTGTHDSSIREIRESLIWIAFATYKDHCSGNSTIACVNYSSSFCPKFTHVSGCLFCHKVTHSLGWLVEVLQVTRPFNEYFNENCLLVLVIFSCYAFICCKPRYS